MQRMYLQAATLTNIRSIESLRWELPRAAAPESLAGWHVIIGDNGAGKSSVLRAIALALVGPRDAAALRQDWNEWLRRGEQSGSIELSLAYSGGFDFHARGSEEPRNESLDFRLRLVRSVHDQSRVFLSEEHSVDDESYVEAWRDRPGWFCASYGPFRRFTGGDQDQEKLFSSAPKLARHLSVFGEAVALTECLEWLKQLQFKRLEGDKQGALLEPLKRFINQPDFLPHDAQLESISSNGVRFVDGNGYEVPVENLSDGYRSILSMTLELIRQLVRTYGAEAIFDSTDSTRIIVPGIVLIDEIDAHLHPTWQRRVGRWFREHFPMIQFIVTTHSPLICQAATPGSVFRMPKPGSDEQAGMVTGLARDRLLYGNVLDAYGTGVFGEVATRSPEALEKLERLAILNQKELTESLSEEERVEQRDLRAKLPTAASALPAPDEVEPLP